MIHSWTARLSPCKKRTNLLVANNVGKQCRNDTLLTKSTNRQANWSVK